MTIPTRLLESVEGVRACRPAMNPLIGSGSIRRNHFEWMVNMQTRIALVTVLFFSGFASVVACVDGSSTTPPDPLECYDNGDCEADRECSDGICVLYTSCTQTAQCPTGQTCAIGGCREDCNSTSDCDVKGLICHEQAFYCIPKPNPARPGASGGAGGTSGNGNAGSAAQASSGGAPGTGGTTSSAGGAPPGVGGTAPGTGGTGTGGSAPGTGGTSPGTGGTGLGTAGAGSAGSGGAGGVGTGGTGVGTGGTGGTGMGTSGTGGRTFSAGGMSGGFGA
jgi:hypothetical protein